MAASEPQEQLSEPTIFGLLSGIIIHPRQAFASLKEAKRGYWWVVFVITVLALALLTYSTTSIQMKARQNSMPLEGVEVEMPEGAAAGATSMFAMALAGGIIGTLVKYLLSTSLIFGLGFVIGGKSSFKQMFRVVVWSTFPVAIRYLVQAIASLAAGDPPVAGLSATLDFMESINMPVLSSLLSQIDFYLVWSMILLGIGISATTRLSKGKTALIVLVYLVIVAVMLIGLGWAGRAIGNMFVGGNTGPGGRPR